MIGLALDRALDIMRMTPLHTCEQCGHEQGNPGWTPQVLTRQASIVSSVLTTTARIDEARLRGRGKDKINELLSELRRMKPNMN